MAERGNPTPGEEQQLRQRAMRRLALALALIVAAIVGLGLLDHYTGRKPATTPPAPAIEPPSIANLPQPKPAAPEAAAPESPPATALPPPPPPSVGDQPTAPSPSGRAPGQPAAGNEIPESTGGAPRAGPPEAPPAARQRPGAEAAPSAGSPAPPLEARTGFVVQLGMFTTVENAQALHARLRQQGIPAFLETRVVVGPFRDRAEADAAQRKLKELGVGGVIVERK